MNGEEYRVVEHRRQQRYRPEAQQHHVNPHGIEERIEMRGPVAVLIDGPYRLLCDGHAVVLGGNQHVELEVVARRRHLEQRGKQARPESPRRPVCVSARLWPTSSLMTQRVAVLPMRLRSGTSPEKFSRPSTSAPRSRSSRSRHPPDIFRVMLSIGIGGDHAGKLGKLA